MTLELISREDELAVIEAFLDRPADGPRALVLEGEAGIGKSTLWLAGVEAARNRGFRVLVSRPAETEQTLPNVVLGDLFADVGPDLLATLSAPRRRAFESALLMRETPDVPIDPRALGVAILSLLPALTATEPLVIAIDDDQWMDPSSAATLQFALRRLGDQPMGLLLSRRSGLVPAAALEQAIDPAGVERVAVGPLSLGGVQLLLRNRLDVTFPRPTLARIHEVSAGNPFFSLELARVQVADRAHDVTLPPTVPPSIEGLVGGRLHELDAPTRRDLLLVAANGRLTFALARAMQIAPEAIDRARAANVIETEGGVIRFSHPLLASTLYQGAGEEERRNAHRRLAEVVDDPVDRGRHLALGADEPDDELAAGLESAAEVARDRGLSIAAAEMAEHAVRLTPAAAAADRHRRALSAARMYSTAGLMTRARAIAADIEGRAPGGRRRAEALILLAELGRPGAGLALLEEALREAKGAPELQAAVHYALADAGYWGGEPRGFAWTERHARAAHRLAERLGDDGLRANVLGILAVLHFVAGDPQAIELAERGYRLATEVGDARSAAKDIWPLAMVLTWVGDTEAARAWLERRRAEWADRDEVVRWQIAWFLALVEVWAGRWETASGYADEVVELSLVYGFAAVDLFPVAFVALHRGELENAREHARRALALGPGAPIEHFFGTLAMCDAWSGSPATALDSFMRAERAADAIGEGEPSMRFWRADHIEVLLQLGRIEEATVLLADWEARALQLGRRRVIAAAMRCRGLIAAAGGDLSTGAAVLEGAVEAHGAAGDRFGQARALLALGATRRRMRQKRSAREAIEEALTGFVALGAASWAATAREELARIGGRQRVEGLSPSELGVATLVAEGRTNREIAAALFLGERTVAGHLTHIYSKLGIRSRTELARTLRTPGEVSAGDPGKVERS